jgi:phage nucleotide-binding protein
MKQPVNPMQKPAAPVQQAQKPAAPVQMAKPAGMPQAMGQAFQKPAQAPAPTVADKLAALKARIKPVASQPLHHSALFYGRSGTGKTTLAGTYPTPSLVLDIREQGTNSLVDVQGIDVLAIESWADIEVVYQLLASGNHQYRTVIIDTVTQMQELAMEKVLMDEGKQPGTTQIFMNHWGSMGKLMKQWITYFRDLPMNVVFLAQDRTTEAQENQQAEQLIPEVGPRLSPSVAGTLCAAVSVIGNTYVDEVPVAEGKQIKNKIQYMLRLGPHRLYTTKIRQPKGNQLPASITNPTYEKIVAIINGGQNAQPQGNGAAKQN